MPHLTAETVLLIPERLELDPRAATYYTQTTASNEACQAYLLAGSTESLIELPTEHINPEAPGLTQLEEAKHILADREYRRHLEAHHAIVYRPGCTNFLQHSTYI